MESASAQTTISVNTRAIVATRRRAKRRETILGLLFVAPATLLTLIFGLFPVLSGFFISMQGGTVRPEGFVGLRNYFTAVGSLAYLLAFALAFVLLYGAYMAFRIPYTAMRRGNGDFYFYLLPGTLAALATMFLLALLFARYTLELGIWPLAMFVIAFAGYAYLERREHGGFNYLLNSWLAMLLIFGGVFLTLYAFSELDTILTPYLNALSQVVSYSKYVLPLDMQFLALWGAVAAGAAALAAGHVRGKIDFDFEPRKALLFGLLRWLMWIVAVLLIVFILGALNLLQGTLAAFASVTPDRLAAVTSLQLADFATALYVWPDIFAMLLGITLIVLAFVLWRQAARRESTPGMLGSLAVAVMLMAGGWLFIGQLPQAAASGDPRFFDSLVRTVSYSVMTVPLQLSLGLLLAYLLFFEVKRGKSLYRVIFFIPYIAPTVATAAVFTVVFSLASESPISQFNHLLGLSPQWQWLHSTQGVFQLMAQQLGGKNTQLPGFLVGPSLPLVSAAIYSLWVFSGYDAVIFLAGLGSVPFDLIEAAQVDGAGRWANFRHIIFPLLSPTTFFLSLLAIIGTFKAFDSIYVLRDTNSRGAMDTATIYIYDQIQKVANLPYASALAIVVFGIILILTLIRNRMGQDEVFYG